jgi:cobalt-zinc-cadmium efflux system outer membrane protein
MKLRKLAILWIVIVVSLAGCATFQPKPISPDQAATAFEARTLDSAGLKKFLEATLRHEIAPWPPKAWSFPMLTLVAFYYQPDLDVARARWDVAKAGIVAAGGRPNPSIGFTPQYDANAASGISPWTLGFSFDIPLETADKRGYRVDQAKHLSEAARLNIAAVAWQVRSRLRARFLDLYAVGQTEDLLARQRSVHEEIVKLLEQRLSYGEASQPDVTQARISLAQTSLSLRNAQRQKAEARVQLADALGLPVSALDAVNLSFDLLNGFSSTVNSLLADVQRRALFNRPDILGALAEYAASQSALQLEIAKQYPDIHLGPGYSWDQGENKWSVGLSLTLPVFNRNQGPIAEAEARRTETAARFTALQARVIGEVARALAGYQAALRALETADALVSSRKEQQHSVQSIFDLGQTDRLELVSVQLEVDSAMLSRLDAFFKVEQSLALLEDAMQSPLDPLESFATTPEINPRSEEEKNP